MRNNVDASRLLHVFSNFVDSGPELRAVALMNAFGRRFRHLIVSMDGRSSALNHVSGEVEVRVLPAPVKRGSIRTAYAVQALLRREAPNALLTYNWGAFDALLAAWKTGFTRVVHHEDGFNADEADRFKLRRVWGRRVVLRRASAVVVPSDTLAEVAQTRWRIARPRLQVIPNGVTESRLRAVVGREALREQLAIPRDAFVIGTVAHMRPEKRLDRLVDLVAEFPESRRPHCVLVGDGADRGSIEALGRERGVAAFMHFVGSQQNVGDYLRAFDTFVMTSDTEQMPVALLEAMACGVPVVSTRVGDVARMLPASQLRWTIALSSQRDVIRGLMQACAALEADQTERVALGRQNMAHVGTHFSFDVMFRRYEEVYDNVLSAH